MIRSACLWLLAVAVATPLVAQPARVASVFSDGNLPGTLRAWKTVLKERPELKDRVELHFLT